MDLTLWQPLRRELLRLTSSLFAAPRSGPGAWLAEQAATPRGVKWLAFYGATADELALAEYDVVVLDPMFTGVKDLITRRGARVIGYLSLGEIRLDDPFYTLLDPAAILEASPAWPGTRRIDVRHPAWSELVLGQIIPAIIASRFTGLFLDTLDTPPFLERQDPAGKPGMLRAAVELVRAIRDSYPQLSLLMNRGYELLPAVVGSIDGLVAESLIAGSDADGYKMNSQSDIEAQLSMIKKPTSERKPLPVLSLDYWDPLDTSMIQKIYLLERQYGHHPYVGTRLLDRIVPEPIA